jgi:hypothetical protein
VSWLLWWRPPCLHRVVIVNMRHDSNSAIRGVLWASRGAWLVVRNAQLLAPAGVTPIDGDVLVHRDNLAFLQVPTAGSA